MKTSRVNTLSLTACAVCGAAYAVLTLILAPISFGAVQFRVSEALCILPFFLPATSWGLFIGCMAANLISGNIFDVVFGSLATLLACAMTAHIGKKGRSTACQLAACLPPVIFNALIVGAVITKAYSGLSLSAHPEIFALNAFQVGLGEAGVMCLVAFPLMRCLGKQKFFLEFIEKASS